MNIKSVPSRYLAEIVSRCGHLLAFFVHFCYTNNQTISLRKNGFPPGRGDERHRYRWQKNTVFCEKSDGKVFKDC